MLLDKSVHCASRSKLIFLIICFRTYYEIVSLLLLCVAVYYDVENVKDPVSIVMNLTDNNLFRMWEIKVGLPVQTLYYELSCFCVPEQHVICHGLSRHMQGFCVIKVPFSQMQ